MNGTGESVRLRAVVAVINHEMALLQAQVTPFKPSSGLVTAWGELVELLALGPTPEVRKCPVCDHHGMRAATRCGFCWTALEPITATESA